MLAYVLNKQRRPLMPCHPAKARLLLKQGKAKVVNRKPFIIQLVYGSSGYTQNLTLGMDTGFKMAGVSVVSVKKEVFSAQVKLRTDVSSQIVSRRMYRRNRRNRLRYRKPRFLNRKGQPLSPGIKQKVDAHLCIINKVKSILPVSCIIIETGSFDPHKLKDPDILGKNYQQGEQYGYDNVKAYVLARDAYQCQAGKKGCSSKLHVHHIKFKSQGGSDRPANLITLCEKHHEQLHNGKLKVDVQKHKSLKPATVMNIIRSQLLKQLPQVIETFGYITKAKRKEQHLEKRHYTDAFIIAGGNNHQRLKPLTMFFKRKNNRSLQKNRKGFKPSIRTRRYAIQPYDLVSFHGNQYRAVGIQNRGTYLKMTDEIKTMVKNIKHIKVIYHQKTLVCT